MLLSCILLQISNGSTLVWHNLQMPAAPSDGRYALAEGTLLRDYTIEAVLGHGGFGIVYRALHNELRHLVAIKEYLPVELAVREGDAVKPRNADYEENYADGLRRFRDEAQALISLNGHSNIVACRDFFRGNGTAYLVMDFVDGQPLSEVLRQREEEGRPFDETDLLTVGVPLAEGLAHVHQARILHRDIKPANILIRQADQRPVLIDFGAAKQSVAEHTRSFAPYTEGYAALEQVSDGELGPWTDLYGLGAVMWRIVAGGNPPWHPPNPVKVESRAAATLSGTIDPFPTAQNLGFGRFDLRTLKTIDRCLCLNNSERIRDCSEFLTLIPSRHAEGNSQDDQFDDLSNLPRWSRPKTSYLDSNSVLMKSLLATVIAVLALGIHSFYSSHEVPENTKIRTQAIALYSGIDAQQDYLESLRLFHAVGNNGDPLANMWLARAYYLGEQATAIRDIKSSDDEWKLVMSERPPVTDHEGRGLTQDRPRGVKLAAQSISQVLKLAESGSAEAMFLVASAYHVGLGVDVNSTRAVDLFKESCDNGFLIACHNLALLFTSDQDSDQDGDENRSDVVRLYQRACDGGFIRSCLNLGDLYDRGHVVDKDASRARELFQISCDGGDELGCVSLGLVLLNDFDEFAAGIEYLRRACDGGAPRGCLVMTNIGFRYLENSPDDRTTAFVADLFEDACTAEFWRGCAGLARLLLEGNGVPVDSSRAVGLYEDNCHSGYLRSCVSLGFLYENGRGVALDISRAIELYETACDGDDMDACVRLGRILARQEDNPLDLVRSVGLFQTACDAGNAEGCTNLGVAFLLGSGVSSDFKLGVEFIQRACDSEYDAACEILRPSLKRDN